MTTLIDELRKFTSIKKLLSGEPMTDCHWRCKKCGVRLAPDMKAVSAFAPLPVVQESGEAAGRFKT